MEATNRKTYKLANWLRAVASILANKNALGLPNLSITKTGNQGVLLFETAKSTRRVRRVEIAFDGKPYQFKNKVT